MLLWRVLWKQVKFVSSTGFGEQRQAALVRVTFACSRPGVPNCASIARPIREPSIAATRCR